MGWWWWRQRQRRWCCSDDFVQLTLCLTCYHNISHSFENIAGNKNTSKKRTKQINVAWKCFNKISNICAYADELELKLTLKFQRGLLVAVADSSFENIIRAQCYKLLKILGILWILKPRKEHHFLPEQDAFHMPQNNNDKYLFT